MMAFRIMNETVRRPSRYAALAKMMDSLQERPKPDLRVVETEEPKPLTDVFWDNFKPD